LIHINKRRRGVGASYQRFDFFLAFSAFFIFLTVVFNFSAFKRLFALFLGALFFDFLADAFAAGDAALAFGVGRVRDLLAVIFGAIGAGTAAPRHRQRDRRTGR